MMRAEAQAAGKPSEAADQSASQGLPLAKAMQELDRAIKEGHAQPICVAYLAARAASRLALAEFLALAAKTLGRPVQDDIVSAYAGRKCFMCAKSAVPCDQCEETGLNEAGKCCPSCNGVGMIPCSFCEGTGWADRNTVPRDLRTAVLYNQLDHVRTDLRRLEAKTPLLKSSEVLRLSRPERARLAVWMMRLQARLIDLSHTELPRTEAERQDLLNLAEKVREYLQLLPLDE